MKSPSYVLGWKEHVWLPDWNLNLRAKLDTGARSSALHVRDIEVVRPATHDTSGIVRFDVVLGTKAKPEHHPIECPMVATRRVRDTGARSELRPVVRTEVIVGQFARTVEITLTDRSGMNFRMLLGRRALDGACVVDPGHGYLAGRPVARPPAAQLRTPPGVSS